MTIKIGQAYGSLESNPELKKTTPTIAMGKIAGVASSEFLIALTSDRQFRGFHEALNMRNISVSVRDGRSILRHLR